ncbi:cysteine desulfurase family protein [Pullulanibacillus sp. KACC 23026]|uniref:cysteine desulfurase family protein n=1 Tax=Pullulanibacillus sp. KACC 23026 TaxID=3028315 RepID=UPI0023AE8F20|nr:cysteine desulfurase family protein [Pullulanibacillus sp. KACC 23026]WEG14089.1 cysteine desulfurase family protein [Pullulanibacillus sp. KACC 23026]
MDRIYLDHSATTPMHPEVIQAMLPVMEHVFGNPSSIHAFGREASKLMEEARTAIAKSIQAKPKEIIFTGGGTEADNLAIIGAARAAKQKKKGNHIITTAIEHHAVLKTCEDLEKNGFEVTYLKVDESGIISLSELEAAIRPETILVSVMYGNNEVGTLQPIEAIGKLFKETDILFHTDAVQAFGLESINVQALNIDLLSMTGHKINGPKGIGFLYCQEEVTLSTHLHGGEQERKRRAGTQNVPGIVGLKKAIEIMEATREEKRVLYRGLQDVLLETLDKEGIQYEINGDRTNRLPHILNLFFPGVQVESLLMNLDLSGVAVSSGSACTAGTAQPSHVLSAMYGEAGERPLSSIRISFGLYNTKEQVSEAAVILAQVVNRLVKLSV